MDFQTFHKYMRLSRRGLVKPLSCQHCGKHLTLVPLRDDKGDISPALRCLFCVVLTIPGTKMYSDIEAVVKEHYT